MSTVAAPVGLSTASTYPAVRSLSVKGLMVVVVAHVGVLASLDMPLPLRSTTTTLMVQIIAPIPELPHISPVPPQPNKFRPVSRPAPPQFTAQTAGPSAVADVPLVTQVPLAPINPAPAPMPVAPVPATPITTPARFEADYLQNPPPTYPALSRRIGEQGQVLLRVFVEASGHPGQIEVKTGSGSPRLDQAAQDAVWRWQFVPARRGLEAIGTWVLVPLIFNLRS